MNNIKFGEIPRTHRSTYALHLLWCEYSLIATHIQKGRDYAKVSYAGARSAHMKVLYPDIVFGGIASNGVTEAAISNWGYYDIIRRVAPANCSAQFITAVKEVDNLLSNSETNYKVKSFFGMPGLTLDSDLTTFFSVSLRRSRSIASCRWFISAGPSGGVAKQELGSNSE
jgi:hypothetical protein